jgi:hypothetical protein
LGKSEAKMERLSLEASLRQHILRWFAKRENELPVSNEFRNDFLLLASQFKDRYTR